MAHMKYIIDDLDPTVKHLWGCVHDEINGVLIFMTEVHEEYFVGADIWMIDGTFRTTPKNYTQILNIMGANLFKKNIFNSCSYSFKRKERNRLFQWFKAFIKSNSKFFT